MSRFVKDSNGYYYTTVKDTDTLSGIVYEYCKEFGKTYNGEATWRPIATLNNMKDANKVFPGDKIYLTGKTTASSSSSSSSGKSKNQVIINYFGKLSTGNTLYAGWKNQQPTKETDHFETQWEYTIKDTGAGNTKSVSSGKRWTGKWDSNVADWEDTFDIPDNAEIVWFRVKPVAKEKSKDDKGNVELYFVGEWTNWNGDGKYKPYDVSQSSPPSVPPNPVIELDKPKNNTFTAMVDGIDMTEVSKPSHIEFQVIKNDSSQFGELTSVKISSTGSDTAKTYFASFKSKTLDPGADYKVRCRATRGNVKGEWSDYSNVVSTVPSTPKGFTDNTPKAKSSSTDGTMSVYLKWTPVTAADEYEIECVTNIDYFDSTDQEVKKFGPTKETYFEAFSLEKGHTYYFRLRAVNGAGSSGWSDVSSVILGEKPDAPTTWSSASTVEVDGDLYLYWVHNSKDGSSQTWAELEMEVHVPNGKNEDGSIKYQKLEPTYEVEIENSTEFEEKDKTSRYDAMKYLEDALPDDVYENGFQLRWRVCTRGVLNVLGAWSIVRIVDIHARPTVTLAVEDATNTIDTTFDTIGSFPISITATTQPDTQDPIGFYLSIVSNDAYETVDSFGNDKMVSVGEQIYSKYFDQGTDLETVLSAGDVDLENNAHYTLKCMAAMDSGLTAETSMNFTVSWVDQHFVPNAAIQYDARSVTTNIRPYCEEYTTTFGSVTYDRWKKTYTADRTIVKDEVTGEDVAVPVTIDVVEGYPVSGAFTTTGEQVFLGSTEIEIDADGNVTGGEDVYYYEIENGTLIPGITLSVYRREFDGSYTELATGIDNTKNTYITDPHPALNLARYRIVATTDSTGAVSYYDVPGLPINVTDIIIQWSEDWSSYDAVVDASPADPTWSGSMLRLPYNVDVSDSYGVDVSLIAYAGRKRPVTYYGTQLGESSTWNTTIPKDDAETLHALRRLAIWTGDCYVREPSGSGYWANVSVSFSQKHGDMTIPVTLNIKRVEGGA